MSPALGRRCLSVRAVSQKLLRPHGLCMPTTLGPALLLSLQSAYNERHRPELATDTTVARVRLWYDKGYERGNFPENT